MLRRIVLVGVLLGLSLSLAGCAGGGKMRSTKRHHIAAFRAVPDQQPVSVTHAWSASKVGSRATVSESYGGVIAQAGDTGELRLVDAHSGAFEQQIKTGLHFTSRPALSDKYVMAATQDGHLHAFDRATGAHVWDQNIQTVVLSQPVVSDAMNRVWVLPQDGRLQALDLDDGTPLWELDIPQHPALTLHRPAEPILSDQTLYIGGRDGQLRAVSALDGQLLWERIVALPQGRSDLQRMVDVIAPPAVEKQRLYVVSYQGKLMALTRNNAVDWSHDLSSLSPMAVDTQSVYITDTHGDLWAIDKFTGLVRWRQEALSGHTLSGPVLVEGQILLGDDTGYMHWFETSAGQWIHTERKMSQPISRLEVVADGQLLATDPNGGMAVYQWTF